MFTAPNPLRIRGFYFAFFEIFNNVVLNTLTKHDPRCYFIYMTHSRTKFIFIFFICGFAFMFITTSLLGSTGVRGFPQLPDSVMRTGSNSLVEWKRVGSRVVLPIKIILLGPLMPYFDLLRREPDTPPPFFTIGILFYWTILASAIHYLLGKLKRFCFI